MLHEPFCTRTVKKCGICEELFNIEDEEDHMKENHTEINCKFCEEKFPKTLIDIHSANCDDKPTECKYCSLHMLLKEKKEHEYICGAKTELCPTCKKYIQVKNYDVHLIDGCFPEETYLNHHIDIKNIPIIKNKKPMGSIRDAAKLGLINKTKKPNEEIKSEDRDVHKELGNKIDELMRSKDKNEGDGFNQDKISLPGKINAKVNLKEGINSSSKKIVKKNIINHAVKKSSENKSDAKNITYQTNEKEINIHNEKHLINIKNDPKEKQFSTNPNIKFDKISHTANESQSLKANNNAKNSIVNKVTNNKQILNPTDLIVDNTDNQIQTDQKVSNKKDKYNTPVKIVNSAIVKGKIFFKNIIPVEISAKAMQNNKIATITEKPLPSKLAEKPIVKAYPYKKQANNELKSELNLNSYKNVNIQSAQEIKLPSIETNIHKNENLINPNSNKIPIKNKKELSKFDHKKNEFNNKENKNLPMKEESKQVKKTVKKKELKEIKHNINLDDLNNYSFNDELNADTLGLHYIKHDTTYGKNIPNLEDEVLKRVLEFSKIYK